MSKNTMLSKANTLRCTLAMFAAYGCADVEDRASSGALMAGPAREKVWAPYDPAQPYEGKSLAEWAVAYQHWMFSWSDCKVSLLDPDGSACGAFQDKDSPVFFLQLGEPNTERSRCDIPANKAILIPLIAASTDNAGEPEEKQRTPEELEGVAQKIRETFTDLKLVIDSKNIEDLESYAVEPTRYSYELGPEPNFLTCYGAPGITGRIDPAFVTGYFVLMPPPPPGDHSLEYAGVGYAYYEEWGMEVATANHVRASFATPTPDQKK